MRSHYVDLAGCRTPSTHAHTRTSSPVAPIGMLLGLLGCAELGVGFRGAVLRIRADHWISLARALRAQD